MLLVSRFAGVRDSPDLPTLSSWDIFQWVILRAKSQ